MSIPARMPVTARAATVISAANTGALVWACLGALLASGCGREPVAMMQFGPRASAPCDTDGQSACEGAPPKLDELRRLLASHAKHSFSAEDHVRGCPEDQSLGAYTERLLAYGSGRAADVDPTDHHSLEGGCGEWPPSRERAPVDPSFEEKSWYCRIVASVSDRQGESPWRYELRFKVERSSRALDLSELGCPGSP